MLCPSKVTLVLLVVVLLVALVSTAAFWKQSLAHTGRIGLSGGFGAGHGSLDLVVALPVVPWMWLMDDLRLPHFIEQYDLLLIVWFPTLLNAMVIYVAATAIRGLRRALLRAA